MKPTFQFRCVLAAVVFLSVGFVLPGAAQTEFTPCDQDGNPPAGENQCECPEGWQIYRGEYTNAESDYQVRLPDGVAATTPKAPCKNHGLRIDLTHPNTGEPDGDFPLNYIWVFGVHQTRKTFAEFTDGFVTNFAKTERESSDESLARDPVIDQPVRTSLSSLAAIHLKASRTDVDHGELIYEVIIANNPKKEIIYEIEMISPASGYEKNHQLFKAVVDGFSYTPTDDVQTR